MHKPKRKSKYWEQFSYEYDGVTYSGKKNCCEKLGLRYLGVLQHAHDYNCTFEEAISQMLENKQKKEFVFRNRKWLSLDTCCDFYKINKYSVQQLQYQCGYTVQEALERSINHANLLRFKYKGKNYASFRECCKELGIPECTVRRCMRETGRSKTVALNYCLKKAENRAGNQKVYNPSPFIYKGKKYDSFVKCCWNYNLEADKVRQKCIAEDISLAEALNYYLIQHPVRRKNDYDSTICHKSIAEQCRQYGIKYYDVYNYSSRYNCSKEEAIKHCFEVKQKLGTDVIEFDGVKYADLHECCRMLKFPYRRVLVKIMNSDCSVQETLQNLKQKKERLFGTGDIENITLENGKCYENIKELCSDLRIREGTLYGYALRNECSITEAADYYAKREEVFQNVALKVGDQFYNDLRQCCEEQGIRYKDVYRRMVEKMVSAEEAVEYFLKRKDRKAKEKQFKRQTNFEPGVPKKVVIMGKEYPSKTSCYDDLKIQKKLVLKRMRDTNCSFEEAVIATYQARIEKEFHFHGEVYRSFVACCKAYGVAQEYIAIKAKREGITRQEAIEKILALREKGTL